MPDVSREGPIQPFLPDMCTLQAVFLLVLLGELLALALTVSHSGLLPLDWQGLGLRSFLIQWVVLLSAALLCPLRWRLSRLPGWLAAACCYLLVLAVTLVCSWLGLWLLDGGQPQDLSRLLTNLLLAAIFAGVVLRYLYVQQQWSNQQKAELKARIQALQSRIQPHFLFNSMNSIASLIATRPQLAEQLVEDLSSLFRASLAEPGLVSLADELALCRQYLAIEQARLGERLQTRWSLSEEVLASQEHWRIPSLLLQPLLENAVQHGIQPLPGGGRVDIVVRAEGGELQIEVSNPVAADSPPRSGHRLALDNIRHRLQAHFGNSARLQAQLTADSHFQVWLSYPLKRSDAE